MSTISKNLDTWLDYISKLHSISIDPGLSRIFPVAAALGLTHFDCPVVVVAGTNGKGSVIRSLEMIYLAAGYRVCAYTSPHLLRFNERLRTNGINTVDSLWEQAFEAVEANRKTISLSFFEFTTLAALWICRQQRPDLLLLEVGMGGRLDAVNVVASDVAVITNVALDHTEWLGNTREAIAFEKAGIFRANVPAVCGDPDPPQTLLDQAKERNASLYCYQRDYYADRSSTLSWVWRSATRTFADLPLSQLKKQNVATAIMTTNLLPLTISREHLVQGIARTSLPGRYERISDAPVVILDVAHNPQSCAYLARRFAREQVTGKRHAIVAMLNNKDIAASLAALRSTIDVWWVTSVDTERSARAEVLLQQLTGYNVASRDSVTEALDAARQAAEVDDAILVFGSFYTVAAAKQYFERVY